VQAATGRPREVDTALATLERIAADAAAHNHLSFAFEARLAQAEIERANKRPAWRDHMASLAKDARTAGFLRLARHASPK
jgi:hypothetical protein